MAPKPVSERRLAANRANALKSTGPRTAEGKRKSSRNASKHLLYAKAYRLPPELESLSRRYAAEQIADIRDPLLRALLFKRYYLEGHRAYFRITEAALFEEALISSGGDQRQADYWLVKQKTHLMALQRYYGSLAREINRSQRAILGYMTQPTDRLDKIFSYEQSQQRAAAAPCTNLPDRNKANGEIASYDRTQCGQSHLRAAAHSGQ